MSIQDMLNNCANDVTLDNSFSIQWSVTGVGFGSFFFSAKEDGSIEIQNECMSKEFIKKVLCMMVDGATLNDEISEKNALMQRSTFEKAKHGREPTEDEIIDYMRLHNEHYYNARERLREQQYGGLPPEGYSCWGDFWKSY
jgi:hypothetical protein